MDWTHRTALIGLLALAPQSSFLQPVRAEEPPKLRVVTTGRSLQPRLALTLSYSDDLVLGTDNTHSIQRAEILAPPVPRECKPSYMVGPGLGIPLGLSTATVGSVLAWAGSVDFWGPTPNNQGAIAGGTLLIGAGLATFIYSSVKLSKNRHSRERLCHPGHRAPRAHSRPHERQRPIVASARPALKNTPSFPQGK